MYHVREVLLHLEPWLQQFPYTPEFDSQQLAAIREQRSAADFGVQTPEVTRVAAPFFDVNGDVIGTIGVAGPVFYLPPENSEQSIAAVIVTAQKLSDEFGHIRFEKE